MPSHYHRHSGDHHHTAKTSHRSTHPKISKKESANERSQKSISYADELGKALATIACERVVYSPRPKKHKTLVDASEKEKSVQSSRESGETKKSAKMSKGAVKLPKTPRKKVTPSKEIKEETSRIGVKRDGRGRLRDARGRFVREVKH
ncbi:hypothetical protein TELCIR_13606 [Teladorsagia circumcincta]|uniref:Uncharacterized protein n=1 Tax=Teladorsagia circumcincta TaxID=45464 RepID=A0A2G9U3J3_TELCI|nr:hypothetical protein TELCIR_13606 [Teladorsagia circumcincta]